MAEPAKRARWQPPPALRLRKILRELRAIMRLTAGLDQVDVNFHFENSSARKPTLGAVAIGKELRGVSN